MASQELKQIWEALKKVSDKQEEYKKLYLKNQEQDTAASNSFAGTIDVQGKHLEEVSEMISSIEVTVRELAHKVSINERRIDDLEQYSRSNGLILHGCQNVPAKATNEIFESFVLNTLNSRLNLPSELTHSDIDISHVLPSAKNKNPIIIKFVRRTVRNMVFNHKSNLKTRQESDPKLALTESLTKRRLRLVEQTRESFGFKNVWTLKGSVFCKFMERKHHIDDFCDINTIRFPDSSKVNY